MAAGEEKQDELEKFFGKSESSAESRPQGQFTRAFFGLDLDKPQPPARSLVDEPDLPAAVRPNPEPPRAPGQFTRIFGAGNTDAQPQEWPAQDQPPTGLQNRTPLSEPGTFTDLFTAPNQVPSKPLNSQPGAFTALFQSEKPTTEPAPEFRQFSSSANSLPALGLEAPGGVLPGISRGERARPREDVGAGAMPFAEPNRAYDPTTRIFSSPKPPTDQATAAGGPSAFTRVIASSTLRAAEDQTDSGTAAGSNPLPPAVSMPSIPVPAIFPQSPIGNMQAQPPHSQAYPPQQQPPIQMAMPPVAWPPAPQLPSAQMQPPFSGQMPVPPGPQVAWPPAPQLPSAPPPQVQPEAPTPQQKLITYLPLIFGLSVLLFLAVVLILIFAVMK